jgi:hypothetical protein
VFQAHQTSLAERGKVDYERRHKNHPDLYRADSNWQMARTLTVCGITTAVRELLFLFYAYDRRIRCLISWIVFPVPMPAVWL